MFTAQSKIPGRNYLKDEVVIRNADAGKGIIHDFTFSCLLRHLIPRKYDLKDEVVIRNANSGKGIIHDFTFLSINLSCVSRFLNYVN